MTRILWVGHFGNSKQRPNETKYVDALRRSSADVVTVGEPWDEVERHLDKDRFDALLFSKCRDFPIDRLAAISMRPERPVLIQVLFDLMDYSERVIRGVPWPRASRLNWWLPMARYFDLVIMKEEGLFSRYREIGVECFYLDQAAELLDEHAFAIPTTDRYDVCFIGGYDRYRRQAFSDLSSGYSSATYGPGWHHRPARVRTGDAHPAVYGRNFVQAVRSARVVWGESRRHDIEGYWSDRVYQVLGAGGVFLTKYTPGLERVFENGTHLMWYRTVDEARANLAELVNDGNLRARLRTEGRRHIAANHTYDHRARELLTLIDQPVGRRS